jgi:NADPH:quinone reductase-like Zn-dependent oxidoreductase
MPKAAWKQVEEDGALKAVICTNYGPPEVLKLTDMPAPVPKDNQVLIRVRAASVTAGDCEIRGAKLPGWVAIPFRLAFGVVRPRRLILGQEVAGEIAAVGSAVTRFRPGDRVFGSTGFVMGAYAEYCCLNAEGPLAHIPEGISFAEAAGIPVGGLNGIHFVRHAGVTAGDKVLINGAGGSIGTFAVQLVKHLGAEVTAVDRADKLDMLSGIGADHVVDYAQEDFTSGSPRYDVIIDVVGKASFTRSLAALRDVGRLFLGNPRVNQMLRRMWVSRRGSKRVLFQFAGESREDLTRAAQWVADGAIRIVIDRHFALADIVDAHRYVDANDKKGVVVISVDAAG